MVTIVSGISSIPLEGISQLPSECVSYVGFPDIDGEREDEQDDTNERDPESHPGHPGDVTDPHPDGGTDQAEQDHQHGAGPAVQKRAILLCKDCVVVVVATGSIHNEDWWVLLLLLRMDQLLFLLPDLPSQDCVVQQCQGHHDKEKCAASVLFFVC